MGKLRQVSTITLVGWVYIGDEILSRYIGIVSSAMIRIPIKQPLFHEMSLVGFDYCSIFGTQNVF